MQLQASQKARRVSVKGHPGIHYRELANGKRRYEFTYYDSDGIRRWKVVEGNLTDAEGERDAIRGKKRRGERVAPSKLTLEEASKLWLAQQTKLRPRTRQHYEGVLDRHVLPRLGAKRLSAVSVDDVAALVSELEAKGLAGWTIKGVLVPLSRIMAFAVRRGWAPTNPVRALERDERPRAEKREMRVLDRDEIRELIASSPERYQAIIALSIGTGLRQGEALGLRWQDVDLKNAVLNVRVQRGQDGEIAEPKTPQAKRQVPLSPELVAMLRRHKAASHFSQPRDFVFASQAGPPLAHRNVVRRGLEKATEAAGIGEYVRVGEKKRWKPAIRWHDLRHTAASLLISQGLNVVYVSRILGHADPSTTLSRYAHMFDAATHGEAVRAAQAAALGTMLEPSGGEGWRTALEKASAKVIELR